MAKKMLNPRTTLWVIDEEDVPNINLIDANTVNTLGTNISCAIVRGYTLNPTDSDTDDSASICDSGNVENRLYDNYEGELTAFRDADIQDNVSVYNIAFNFFINPDRRFWVIRRLGKVNTEPLADGDQIEAFLFTNDRTRSVDGGDAGPIQFTVPLLQAGHYTGYFYAGGTGAAPVITAATPSGAAAGDTVTVTGTGFTGATNVTIGGVAGTSLTVVSATSLTFVVPAGSAGSAPIVVTTASGASNSFAYTRG